MEIKEKFENRQKWALLVIWVIIEMTLLFAIMTSLCHFSVMTPPCLSSIMTSLCHLFIFHIAFSVMTSLCHFSNWPHRTKKIDVSTFKRLRSWWFASNSRKEKVARQFGQSTKDRVSFCSSVYIMVVSPGLKRALVNRLSRDGSWKNRQNSLSTPQKWCDLLMIKLARGKTSENSRKKFRNFRRNSRTQWSKQANEPFDLKFGTKDNALKM